MPRRPIVAGQFYEEGSEELREQISSCFKNKFGPGELPGKRKDNQIFGIIAPHAGYVYSGPCQAWAFKEIAESSLPEVYVIIGLSHAGYSTCISLEDWETPLGVIKTDKELGAALIEKGIRVNEKSHLNEHSLEVQIPFLQFVNEEEVKILPIIASEDIDYRELAEKIVKAIDETGKKAVLIASSDFTHFGVSYGYMPFASDVKQKLYELDRKAISFVENLNSTKFLQYTDETRATICGKQAVAVVAEACKMLGAKQGKLLQYYTSGDIFGDYRNAVGYASIIIH